ncbi:uncharacterized protein N0V89_010470 [Didymosphaeria variabile]|uniref:Uncharacterized protein n=1 Tax=Didymosphaeria variabile TaxID=1932322 RepID=A0A9W8XBC1_9PLEO|nr:uncharacterized protein N0V89_010470 [Didymosphaeria variabile]KAJ4346539.1 hypothetical protein N0V89_010470 [Didymosphaeria variabile]
MLVSALFYGLLQQLLVASVVSAEGLIEVADFGELGNDYNCPGGNVYFVAHPVDALLYHNPDLYHDVHTFKCTTVVVFTAGDRGVKDTSFTDSLERGLETSYNFMAGAPVNQTGWDGVKVACGDALITLRYPKDAKGLLLIYLRFPDGASGGQGYKETGQVSLKKLYQNQIQSMSSIDGEITYNLDGLKHLISIILQWKSPKFIRTLDDLTPIAKDGEYTAEHADHSVSARIVHDVIKEYKIPGNVTRQCKLYKECFKNSGLMPKETPDDVKYTVEYLDREYYIT